jgi:drug/metabolite transporter (DMT)-like permease
LRRSGEGVEVYLEVRKRRGHIFFEWNKCLWLLTRLSNGNRTQHILKRRFDYTFVFTLYDFCRTCILIYMPIWAQWFGLIQFYSILFYSILFYSILFYSILFYSILFYSILFYSILFYSILFYSILFFSILFYSFLFYSIKKRIE